TEEESTEPDHEQQFEQEALVGILVHQCLERYVQAADQKSYLSELSRLHGYWKLKLRHLNLSDGELEALVLSMEATVKRTVGNDKISWLFDSQLTDSQCELPLSRKHEGYLSNRVVDRTFLDSDGVRWVIDYKTGKPNVDEAEAEFIEKQKALHKDQLRDYKRLFEELESSEIRTALLFTSIPKLVELQVD
ncbi:MAG: PD-(D/E)XK nuclease family protein, partial [Pseudomonadales bacterium]|nr:PD-(D/E)XK nuclease family protein [Pseudomonadales bacterium]